MNLRRVLLCPLGWHDWPRRWTRKPERVRARMAADGTQTVERVDTSFAPGPVLYVRRCQRCGERQERKGPTAC